ncbi:hypothetical protein K491DRAFT_589730 [Lophiostoma macrostomum CBS 122681]|uniref:F-box domain-containing protein n=1 Tax=Lophiostoma macrostomum CBS 122681 TaxID=1314788 RepID=A0A6A6TMP5_9PLEO|nr:hypothetical protein K491DRAFT_589730 [Lophiostoma macrostomum CBS 122681]
MTKRARDTDDTGDRPTKLLRVPSDDRLSRLSDELLVRILSYTSVSTLIVCQRTSKKLSRLAVDSELWKAAYYNQFVLPRASRIPGLKDAGSSEHLRYSSKLSKWLDDGYLVKNGLDTNWKQQYRLRHNWSQGQCEVSEIVVAQRPPEPPLLVLMHDGIVFTADSIFGLRAWDAREQRDLIASISLCTVGTDNPQLPTSIAIDSADSGEDKQRLVVGFDDGSFTMFVLDQGRNCFAAMFEHPPSSNGMLSALAYSSPHLLTMSEDHLLSLYSFAAAQDGDEALHSPELIYSLRSHTAWPPVSLSLRANAANMTAAIAYALPTYLTGWTIGIQEMRLSHTGELIESRLATAAEEHSHTLSGHRLLSGPSGRSSSPLPEASKGPIVSNTPKSKPTSMSYSHPYLLVSHPDNTLTLYLVRSTSSSLTISSGNRLWGHTSSVSGAHVGMRGKAVSVSRLGDELRVWDLEGGVISSSAKRRSLNGELSVRVQPAKTSEHAAETSDSNNQRHQSLRFALDQGFDDSTVSRGWVGFDEQHVIVLREKSAGSQALVVYDFT